MIPANAVIIKRVKTPTPLEAMERLHSALEQLGNDTHRFADRDRLALFSVADHLGQALEAVEGNARLRAILRKAPPKCPLTPPRHNGHELPADRPQDEDKGVIALPATVAVKPAPASAEKAPDPAPKRAPKPKPADKPKRRTYNRGETQARILAYVVEHPGATCQDVVKGLDTSYRYAAGVLKMLCERGQLRREGTYSIQHYAVEEMAG